MKMSVSVLALALAAAFNPAMAQDAVGDIEVGQVKAYTCTGCHGIPGYNNVYPTFKVPKLGGQNYEYIVAALRAYKSGERAHQTMTVQANSMTDQDIRDIAAYFASLERE